MRNTTWILPTETPHGYCALLRDLDIPVSTAWVKRMLARWNYSRKRVQHTQAKKFTIINVCRYIDHVLAAPQLDPTKLKYLDESRFETRRVRRQYGYSARGERINITAGTQARGCIHLWCLLTFVFILQETTFVRASASPWCGAFLFSFPALHH